MWAYRHVVEVICSGYIYGRILKETHKYFYNIKELILYFS